GEEGGRAAAFYRVMKKAKGRNSKLLPNSFRIISSCIKTVSTNASTAVKSASASVAASVAYADDRKEQVVWAGFDKLEIDPIAFRRVLLLGYMNGFQIFDVEDGSSLSELVSRHDGPVTFLQMLPAPGHGVGTAKYKLAYPMVIVVGFREEEKTTSLDYTCNGHARYASADSSSGTSCQPPSSVRFYSMKSNEYVKIIDFKSAVLMLRCSSRVVAIGLEEQIYCFDALTLEKKFIVVTYPVTRLGEPGAIDTNTGYGPMALGTRWLAYPPNRPFRPNTGRVRAKSVSSCVSPSSSPGSGTMMARYAVESSKHLAAGLLTLGDMGYKKLSKYYPDLLPDSCSSPGWKTGKLAASEPENAGVVAVKDLVSSEVILQFRAHTSPISALCFDPSGTLLVTASVHGNSINIFRIMPSHERGGPVSGDWSTSYVHLYKLYRGMTSAVIQDICFSQYSQWCAIVSSRGTCHIFFLSPFGSYDGIQALHAYCQGKSQFLVSCSPWWSASSFAVNEQHSLPPPTCSLSVVSRIKCSDSGLLNTVSNAAASMVGKTWVPSGAVAAIFHNSSFTGPQDVKPNFRPLEHIIVYTPSGFVVQHEILLPMESEVTSDRTQCLASPQPCTQNEEQRVKVEPLQWWDVCRRLDSMEREDSVSRNAFDGPNEVEVNDDSKKLAPDNVSIGEKKLLKPNTPKSSERSQWYLSNAEVQIKSGRLPLWQKTTVHFHVLVSPQVDYSDGEFEIETASSHEVEIRHKDLLPVFENFRRMQRGLSD
ncbi:hypothetical protein M569_03781, partial [Genlisea aurea]